MIYKMMVPILVLALSTVYVEAYYLESRLGPINGTTDMAWDEKPVVMFQGIRYGKAPVGDMRFKHSQPYGGWDKTYDATEFGPACMQNKGWSMGWLDEVESEDCLFLNIFVPNTVDNMTPRTVMVWIHGGGYYMGASQTYDARNLATEGDVIVVTINYRLGLYGFFTTGDDHIPGNMGIGDQILALKWVRDNIADYGGDPGSVTIFGQSAGGWAVSVLAASMEASGLFQRAIGMSGTTMYTQHRREMGMQSMGLAEKMGCPTDRGTEAVLECFRGLDNEVLIDVNMEEFQFVAVTDDYILSWQPYEAWEYGAANSVDYMTGVTSADGFSVLDFLLGGNQAYYSTGVDEATVKGFIEMYMWQTPYAKNCTNAIAIVMDHYFHNDLSDPEKNLEGLNHMMTDVVYLTPGIQLARFVPAYGRKVYVYYFDQPSKPGTPAGDAIIDVGTEHGGELWYIFGWYLWSEMYPEATEEDHKLTMSVMKAWTSFAKTGKPMWIDNMGMEQSWPEYTWDMGHFMEWRDNLASKNIEELWLDARADFWLYTLPYCDIPVAAAVSFGAMLAVIVPAVMTIFRLRF